MKIKIIVGGLLLLSFLCGLYLIFQGGTELYQRYVTTQNYQETTGYFSDYDIYHSDEDDTTYRLIYTYQVDGQEYTVATDYGSGYLPKRGSESTVKYDPQQPEKAVLGGVSRGISFLFIGLLFLLVPVFMALGLLWLLGPDRPWLLPIIEIGMGAMMLFFGAGVYYLLCNGSFSPKAGWENGGPWILIPLLMMIAGIFQVVRSIFFRNKAKTKRKFDN
jgi:hypothetical protein